MCIIQLEQHDSIITICKWTIINLLYIDVDDHGTLLIFIIVQLYSNKIT